MNLGIYPNSRWRFLAKLHWFSLIILITLRREFRHVMIHVVLIII